MKTLKNIWIWLWVMTHGVLSAQLPTINCLSSPNVYSQKSIPIGSPTEGKGDTLFRNHIPYYYQFPLEININLFFIQKDDGTGNFQENDDEHQRLWNEIIAGISKLFTELQNSKLDSCFAWKDPFLADSYIRLKFNRYYLKNSKYWNWKQYGETAFDISSALNVLKNELEAQSDIPLGISVFFPENEDVYDEYMDVIISGDTLSSKDANFAYTSMPGINYIPKICMPDTYCKFLWMKHIVPRNYALMGNPVTWENNVWYWEVHGLVKAIAHELGHAFNLDHACNHYGLNSCRDALMAQSGDVRYSRTYIPPTEIGKMHKALSEKRLKELVSYDIPSVGTMSITHNLNWNGPFRCYANLDINPSGRLTMLGQVQMPPRSSIEISGHLYIRDGSISCVNASETWRGIRVKKDGLLWLENTTIKDFDIIIEMGGTLVLSGNIRFENGHKLVLSKGAYVCAASNLAVQGTVSKPFYTDGAASSTIISGIFPETKPLYEPSCSPQGRLFFLQKCTEIPETLYIQKEQINHDMTYVGKTILVGNSVDPNSSRLKGDVMVNPPARATFVYKNRLVLDKGFRCNSGGSYRSLRF